MMSTLERIKNVLLSVSDNVFHYTAVEKPNQYIVWAEEFEADALNGDNQKLEQTISGSIDYFTKVDMDPMVDKLQNALNKAQISFRLNSVQYEEETGYIHYEWTWEDG